MTRDELQRRILFDLNDNPDAPMFWTATEVQAYIQDAQEVMAEESPFVKRTFTIPRREGTTIYRLSGVGDSIMAPYRIWLPDLKRRLTPVTLLQLDARHEKWWTVTSDGPWWWCGLNWDSFLIWPPPSEGTGWLEVDCLCWPQPLLDDGDTPELHPSSHEALQLYSVFLGKLKQWDAEGAMVPLQDLFQRYGHVRSQEGVNQIQGRTWSRGASREESDSGYRWG